VERISLRTIGRVASPLTQVHEAPCQPDEGAPSAWLEFEPDMRAGLTSLRPGDQLIVLTWLHHARRDVLRLHPRGDRTLQEAGVFSTRSPDRPNPIGLHQVEVEAVDGLRVRVRHLEAVDGTPILDLKPVLDQEVSRR
jgi:tRNA-Thr(GGU) m(6)t(6)A37 methyltransferase TsaA